MPPLGWKLAIDNLELGTIETAAVSDRHASKIKANATIGSSGTAGTEFSLTMWWRGRATR